ncbi:MAG: FHA domain-containing protein [Deltaproteobacteria bacterium]|nr:FHA domain-containing protein [Deltaproteobacteria bacterium]
MPVKKDDADTDGADASREGASTHAIGQGARPPNSVRRFRLTVVEGPQNGNSWESAGDSCAVGSHPSSDLMLDDPTVSRFHCEIRMDASGARVRDLDSRAPLPGRRGCGPWLGQDSMGGVPPRQPVSRSAASRQQPRLPFRTPTERKRSSPRRACGGRSH